MMDSANRGAKFQLILSMIIFGTIGIFVRFIPYSSGVIAMTRGIVGALFLLGFIAIKRRKPDFAAIKKNLVLLLLTGAFIGINWILLFESYRYTTVATATLCYYLAPIFVIMASPMVFKEKITTTKATAVILSLLGMVLVSGVYKGVGDPSIEGAGNSLGVTLGIGAAVLYASVIILSKKIKDIDPYDQTAVQIFTAGAVLIPYNIITGDLNKVGPLTNSKALILLAIVCLIHTGLAYALYFGSMRTLPAQTIAIFSYIDPVVAILISTFILRENMDMMSVVGAVLILGSTFFSEIRQ